MDNGNMTLQKNNGGCSGFTLKMIAVITMLIDHTAAVFLAREMGNVYAGGGFVTMENYSTWYQIYIAMRYIGRMAFPIYCFLLVEGITHTRSVKKYIGRMVLFAAISEIPFDLAFNHAFFDMTYNNVFVTLLLGLVTIAVIQWLEERLPFSDTAPWNGWLRIFGMIAVTLAGMCVAELLNTDYGASGVVAIVILYLLRQYRLIGFAAAVVMLGIMSSSMEYVALLMLIPMYFYNGQRGRQVKYVFYVFYPVHLLALVGISYLFGV